METSQVRLSQNQWGNWIILPAPTGFSPIFPRTNDEWGLLITAACPCCAYSAAQHSEKTPTVILHHMTRVFPKHISLKSTYIWFPLILHLPHLLLACLGFAAVAPSKRNCPGQAAGCWVQYWVHHHVGVQGVRGVCHYHYTSRCKVVFERRCELTTRDVVSYDDFIKNRSSLSSLHFSVSMFMRRNAPLCWSIPSPNRLIPNEVLCIKLMVKWT